MKKTVSIDDSDISEDEFQEELPIFKHLPHLKIGRVRICDLPTPLHNLENTSKELEREILIKRDDITSKEFGGNKPRKYEFILGDILKKKRSKVISIGALGSNHCLGFAILAKKYGIDLNLYILDQPLIPEVQKNLLRMNYFSPSTNLVYTKNIFWLVLYMLRDIICCRRCHPYYFLEPGASDTLGILGYVNAAFEYYEQEKAGICKKVDTIYLPLGTAGTAIGLLIGLELAYGRGIGPRIVAISVLDSFVNKNFMMKNMCKKVIKFLQKKKIKIPNIHEYMFDRLSVHREYVGKTYGYPTDLGLEAIEILEKDEIYLDKIYTSKAFSGLIDHCRTGIIKKDERVMFWMTKNSIDLSRFDDNKKNKWKSLPSGFHKFYNGKRKFINHSKLKKE